MANSISNYSNPGVYVSQAVTQPQATVNGDALTVCFVGYSTNVPSGAQTDYFLLTSGSTGNQTFTLSQTALSTTSTNFVVKVNNGAYVTLTSGSDYTVTASSLTVLSAAAGTTYSGQQITANYSYATATSGILYNFSNFNAVQATFGPAFNNSTATSTVFSPLTLAASLAYQNGAQNVSCIMVTGTGSEQNFIDAITSASGVLSNPDIDVIVPLIGVSGVGTLTSGILNYLNGRAVNGVYQRAFLGLASTISGATSIASTVGNVVTSVNSSRVTLCAPGNFYISPGIGANGLTTGQVAVGGEYLAAALAGLFVGQTDVYVPITHKDVTGFLSIPNQISPVDSTTVQSLGGTIVRQRNDGSIYVRHGLTTNLSNWLTQEISISAIGDRLSGNIASAIDNSGIIGSPLTQQTLSSLQSIVLATLMRAVNTNLIQSYQNLSYTINPNTPTTVNVSFQYSPTFPLNYVQVSISVNAQTGAVTTASNVGTSVIA